MFWPTLQHTYCVFKKHPVTGRVRKVVADNVDSTNVKIID